MARALTSTTQYQTPIRHNGRIILDPKTKANHLAKYLSDTMTNKDAPPSPREEEASKNLKDLKSLLPTDQDYIFEGEIRQTLASLKPKKAPGLDGITNKMLKSLSDSDPAIKILTNLFNSCLSCSYYPTQWKKGKVILFPKPGKDPSIPSNNRPITLLSSLSKIFEATLLTRLNSFLTIKKTIRPEQMGFRHRHSTTHAILRLVEKIHESYKRGGATQIVLLCKSRSF